MWLVTSRTRFKGMYEIAFPAVNNRDSLIEVELDLIETKQLIQLMGLDLYNQFASNPTDALFAPLFQPMKYGRNFSSGIVEVITAYVYIEYQRMNYSLSTENGRFVKSSSTGTVNSFVNRDMLIYNEHIGGWRAMQTYLSMTFSDYDGQDKSYLFY